MPNAANLLSDTSPTCWLRPRPEFLALWYERLRRSDLSASMMPRKKAGDNQGPGRGCPAEIYQFLDQKIREGGQSTLYPLVEESEKLDLLNATRWPSTFNLVFPNFRVGLVTAE